MAISWVLTRCRTAGRPTACFCLTGVLPLEAEIRTKLPKSLVQVVPTKSPEGLWLRGAQFDLEAVIKALKLN